MAMSSWRQIISQILGWAYFVLWSLSFYPQVIRNHRRRSTDGLSVDFALLNSLGLTAYSVYNGCFLFSAVVRDQYARRHPENPEPTVRWNDFVYALHGTLICCWIGSHFAFARLWNFERKPQRPSSLALSLFGACLTVVVVASVGVPVSASASWEWIDAVYIIGMIKVCLTAVKYTPQAAMNYRRKSTVGFSIGAILLDLSGAVFSLVQLVLDSSSQIDRSGAVGNAAKLLLGNLTVVFDLIFIFQHFYLYPEGPERNESSERDPLLGTRS